MGTTKLDRLNNAQHVVQGIFKVAALVKATASAAVTPAEAALSNLNAYLVASKRLPLSKAGFEDLMGRGVKAISYKPSRGLADPLSSSLGDYATDMLNIVNTDALASVGKRGVTQALAFGLPLYGSYKFVSDKDLRDSVLGAFEGDTQPDSDARLIAAANGWM